MRNTVSLLSDLMSSPDWTPAWMTVSEIAAEMDRLGSWDQKPFHNLRKSARVEFVASILGSASARENRVWVQLGDRYKHAAILTEQDHALIEEWLEARRAAFDEDLSRILLGETPGWRNRPTVPSRKLQDLMRQARPLVEELSSYLQHDFDDETGLSPARETWPVARRIEELAVALTSLFDGATKQSALS